MISSDPLRWDHKIFVVVVAPTDDISARSFYDPDCETSTVVRKLQRFALVSERYIVNAHLKKLNYDLPLHYQFFIFILLCVLLLSSRQEATSSHAIPCTTFLELYSP